MRQRAYTSGNLCGFLYDFRYGESIPAHDHTAHQDPHNVICLLGSVRVEHSGGARVLDAGDPPFDFDCFSPHTITALVYGTRILNLYLRGRPETFVDHYDETYLNG